MEIIQHRNNLDGGLYVLIFLYAVGLILLPMYSDNKILFTSACIGLGLMFIFLHYRRLKISVDKNSISVDFTFLSIPYRRIKKQFDFAKVSKHDTGSISFIKDNKEILEFDYGDDPVEPTVEIGVLKIVHKNKDILIGNTKTSYKLFNEIRQTVLKQAVLADT